MNVYEVSFMDDKSADPVVDHWIGISWMDVP